MEQVIAEVEAHATATGVSPQKVLRDAIGAGWGTWGKWKAGEQFPRMDTVDKIRGYMAANPAADRSDGVNSGGVAV